VDPRDELIELVRRHLKRVEFDAICKFRTGQTLPDHEQALMSWLDWWDAREEVRGAAPSFRKPQTSQTGLAAIIGKWPGDETDEQIDEALDERPATP
jgi:hypothetical protein